MYCVKKKKRNITNLFEFITCDNCNWFRDDEIILIGLNIIRICPIFKGCKNVEYDIVSECFSERLSRMLIEVEKYLEFKDDYIFIWSYDGQKEFIYNLGVLEAFIDQGVNICMIY